jgi:succinate dehydrogenase (ubiquinone) membrane anchor subunit
VVAVVWADWVSFLQKYTNYAMLGLIPAALTAPSSIVFPLDLALGVVLPLHMQLGMRNVVRDYAPNERVWQLVLLGVSLCTALGLARLNFNGKGISATAKTLWVKNKKD